MHIVLDWAEIFVSNTARKNVSRYFICASCGKMIGAERVG
jgi:RNA polymerase-binding transcription factor DksA